MRLLLAALMSCALIGLVAPEAQASSSVRFGIQDDSWLVHGSGTLDDRLDRLESLGVDIVRFNLHWDRIEPVAGEPSCNGLIIALFNHDTIGPSGNPTSSSGPGPFFHQDTHQAIEELARDPNC